MLSITKNVDESTVYFALDGRLDTDTAPKLETAVEDAIDGATSLVFDLKGLEYISSTGLRVFLYAQKIMKVKGEMKILNVCQAVKDIFDITGLSDVLTIE